MPKIELCFLFLKISDINNQNGLGIEWHRPAATVLIGPLAWEPPYAVGIALKIKRQKKKKKKNRMGLGNAIKSVFADYHTQKQLFKRLGWQRS